MAKKTNGKVTRKKKPQNKSLQLKIKQIQNACTRTLDNCYLLFSSAHENIERHGYDAINMLVSDTHGNKFARTKGDDMLSKAKGILEDDLRNTKRNWYWWAAIILDNGFGEIDIQSATGHVEDAVLGDMSLSMPQLIGEVNPDLTDEDILGWAWVLTPSSGIDLDASEDEFLEYLIETCDLPDQDKRLAVASKLPTTDLVDTLMKSRSDKNTEQKYVREKIVA